jgi:hypothetical protein
MSSQNARLHSHANRRFALVNRGERSGAGDVRALRKRMHMTQRAWERGNRKPTGTALMLLDVIRENPRVVLRAVRKARLKTSHRAPPGFGKR